MVWDRMDKECSRDRAVLIYTAIDEYKTAAKREWLLYQGRLITDQIEIEHKD